MTVLGTKGWRDASEKSGERRGGADQQRNQEPIKEASGLIVLKFTVVNLVPGPIGEPTERPRVRDQKQD
ncbi:hypothetical protein [Streptomyces sp. NPDC000229]|uniref:hypothetical protein n=1 Tax=Streptomyces sp. NPDC000229 TaxID=3154247 RepID=UPI00333466B2